MSKEQKKSNELNKKRMTKSDYIEELCNITRTQANKLTVKQLRQLVAKYALG